MDTAYRESTEGLRAEVERLTREVARLSAKQPMAWRVDSDHNSRGGWSEGACVWAVIWVLTALCVGVWWVVVGNDPRVIRGLCLVGLCAPAWLFAFVQRVPR